MSNIPKPRVIGSLAGEPLMQDPDGHYLFTLRQSILLTLEADTPTARPLRRFVDALAETQFGPHRRKHRRSISSSPGYRAA